MAETQAAALRDFLLALERPKQPLDAAFRGFGELLQTSPAVAARFLAIHAQCEPLLLCWPETVGAGTRWEQRESVATFLEALATLLRAQAARDAPAAEAMALRVVRERSANLEKVMTWSDKPLIEFRALELVRALVSVSGAVAREFVRLFNMQSPAFVKMATRRYKKPDPVAPVGDDDEGDSSEEPQKPAFQIREAYVRLVLELTACADKSVHRFALKDGGLTVSLFKSIDGDSPELLALISDKLEALVLCNESLDHRAKAAVWSGANILQLLPLLQSDEDQAAERAAHMLDTLFFAPNALYQVRPAADAFRVFLVKPSAPGAPNSQGTSSFEQSLAVKTIKSTIVAIGVNELLRSPAALSIATKFMTKYPSLIADYLAALSIPLEPRPAYRWFCVASLLQKLLSCSIAASILPDESNDNETEGCGTSWCSPQLLAARLIAPYNYRKELSRGIQHANDLVVYSTLGVMESILHRFEFIVTKLKPTQHRTHAELESELRFLLPSPEALVSLLLKLCGAVTTPTTSSQQAAGLIYVRALSVFRLYIECFPQTMREVKLDFTKLLTWQFFDSGEQEEDQAKPSLQSMIVAEILRFLLVVDINRLSFLLQRGGSSAAGPSKLLQLLLLDVNTPSHAIQELCDKVIARVLLVSGVFGRDCRGEEASSSDDNEEITFWLQGLHQGGRSCAQFVEELVQYVSLDPFASVALYHSHMHRTSTSAKGGVRGEMMSTSPIMISLVAFLNAPKCAESSGWRATYRRDATVVLFAVRVLLSVLYSAGPDARPLALLIASSATDVTHESSAKDATASGEDDSDSTSRKRKRAGDAHSPETDGHEAEDAYSWLKLHCKSQLAQILTNGNNEANSSKKKAKVGKSLTSDEGYSWKKVASLGALRAQLASLQPTAFGSQWESIVSNCIQLTGSFDMCHNYLLAHADADLMPILVANSSVAAKKKGKKASESTDITAHPFVQTLSPAIRLQHLLYRLSHGPSNDAHVSAAVSHLLNVVRRLMHSHDGSLKPGDALLMCDQLLFFFSMDLSNASESGDSVTQSYKSLCELLHLLLTLVMASNAGSTSAARRRVHKLERLLVQYSSAATSSSDSVCCFVWRQLVAARLTAAKFAPITWSSTDSTDSSNLALRSALVPSLAVGALDAHSSKAFLLTALDSLLVRQHRRHRRRRSDIHQVSPDRVLLAHTIRYMSCAISSSEPSKQLTTTSVLTRNLWQFLTSSAVAVDGDRKLQHHEAVEVLGSGLELLGHLGGVDVSGGDIQSAIDTTIVPAIVQEATLLLAADATGAVSTPQMLQRVVRAVLISETNGGAAAFAETLETHVFTRLQKTKDERVSCAVASSVFDVFGRVRTVALRGYVAHSLVPQAAEALLLRQNQQELDPRATRYRAALLRHWVSSELARSDASEHDRRASVDVLTYVLEKLVKKHPKGVVVSRAQLYCILALTRSWCESTSFTIDSAATPSPQQKGEAVVATKLAGFLIRSAVLALSDSDNKVAAKECCNAVGLLVEQFLTRTRLLDAAAVLKVALPVLSEAEAFVKSSDDRQVFRCFVALSGGILRLAAASPASVTFDSATQLATITSHACFLPSLQDDSIQSASARVTLVRVVAGLAERSGVYQTSLFSQLLGAYSMSLSPFDRSVRALLVRFERQQVPDLSLSRVGFRFGASSAPSSSTASVSTARADLVEDAQWIVSGGLEVPRVRATVEHFPLDRALDGASDEVLLSWVSSPAIAVENEPRIEEEAHEDAAPAYDPAYLLPMLAHFVAASALAEDALVQTGLLGVALRATSSRDDRVREYAYAILAQLHENLTAESTASGSDAFKAGRQVHLLLDAFRNALSSSLQRTPSVITVFLNDALSILSRPAHAMYPPVNAFFLARPALDLLDVPMFYALFNSRVSSTGSSAQQYKQERAWLLHSLRRGVREDQDVQLLTRRHALSLLLSFFATPTLADEHTQTLVLQVLLAVASAPAGRALLVTKCAALEWVGAQLARVVSPLLASESSLTASASSSAVSVLLLLMALLRRLVEETEWTDLGSAWKLTAARQTANALTAAHVAVESLHHSPHARSLWMDQRAQLERSLAGVAQAAVGAFALSLPLAALELAVRDVVNAAASSDRHGHEEQALALAETLLDVGGRKQSTAALALVQHAEFDARRLPRWAKLLDEATALVVRSVPVSSAVDGAPQVTPGRLARAKRVLETASALLSSLPALRSARTEARGSDGGAASTVAALV